MMSKRHDLARAARRRSTEPAVLRQRVETLLEELAAAVLVDDVERRGRRSRACASSTTSCVG